MKKAVFIIIIVILVSAGVAAQSLDIIPHVTDIQVESSGNLIKLSWVDSPQARGQVFIFRSARPFIGSIPQHIRPVTIRYGQQYYIDDTDDMESVHYLITASDISGLRYDVILPRVNSTSINFIHTGEGEEPSVSVTFMEAPVLRDPRSISNLKAVHDGDKVIITYDTSGPRRTAILYRSMHPVRQPHDLLNAVIVQSGIISPFIDVPVPGVPWFYTVIFEDEIATGTMGIIPGENTTVSAVLITAQQTSERSLRPIPLPLLTLRSAMPEGFFTDIPSPTPLGIESLGIVGNMPSVTKMPMVLKGPRVFAVDLEAPTGGEESALFQIVMEYFIKFEWESARLSLQHYLSLPRSRDVELRARFYLAQTLYYTGRYRESLMEFLAFRTHHPVEANSWIEAVLTAMVY